MTVFGRFVFVFACIVLWILLLVHAGNDATRSGWCVLRS
jgi:hypothetical protein